MKYDHHQTPACGSSRSQAGLNPWLKLIIGAMLILGFIFGVGSAAQFIPGARHMAEVIEAHDIRATAIYYTDFDQSAEGSGRIRDSLDYAPSRNGEQ